MKLSNFRRLLPLAAFVFGTAAISVLTSCGGGGGGPSMPAATPTPAASCPGGATFTPNYASSVTLLHWTFFPITVYFTPDSNPTRQANAIAGFNEWVTATHNGVTYTVVNDPSQAEVTVSFFTFTGGVGDELGLTTVDFTNDNVIHSAQISLGVTGDSSVDDLTAAHEFGHTLGISGHSPSSADIMYFEGNINGCGCITTSDLNTLLTAYCGTFNHDVLTSRGITGPMMKRTLTTVR